ncbi:hypothetical protein D9M68_976280 [compost metagenome]
MDVGLRPEQILQDAAGLMAIIITGTVQPLEKNACTQALGSQLHVPGVIQLAGDHLFLLGFHDREPS